MQKQASEANRLELKVCERCGGLWLRPQASGWRYCRRCKPQVDRLPIPRELGFVTASQERAH